MFQIYVRIGHLTKFDTLRVNREFICSLENNYR